ncbi:MAG: outer membrane lipoprotein-sorting protein [Magnetococcales bacterium]|nr:outer membrane lipoprotein-sorting protein [Magnetococcales bacterium]
MGRCWQGVVLIGLFLTAGLTASLARAVEPQEILRQVDRNLHPDSIEMYLRLENRRGAVEEPPVVIYAVRKGGDRVLALVVAPNHMKGRTALRNKGEVWVRIPGEVELRQETLAQSFFGDGILSNGDLLGIDFQLEFEPQVLKEDAKTITLRLEPKADWVKYAFLEMLVDKEFMVPRRIVQYGAGGMAVKTIEFSDLKKLGGNPDRPAVLRAHSALNPNYRATLRYGSMQNRELPDEIFVKGFLDQVESLLQ